MQHHDGRRLAVTPRVRSGLRRAMLVAACLLGGSALPAQVVGGRLLDASTGRALDDAVVGLLDDGGRQVAATLARAGGTYTLAAPAPGRYRVRVRRVGYRATLSEVLTLGAGARVAHDVRVTPVAIALRATRITGRARCLAAPNASGDARAVAGGDADAAALWEALRTALEAVRLTTRDRRVRVTVRDSRAVYGPQDRAPRRVETAERSGVADAPYRAPAPDRLAIDGYVRREADAYWFHAPDADALLSDAFAAAYCLRPAEGPAPAPGLVGLAFEPTTGDAHAQGVAGIRGVLWADARTAALHSLRFTYAALPPEVAAAVRPLGREALGGRVEFAALPGGAWIVRRWAVRAPLLAARPAAPRLGDVSGAPGAGALSTGGSGIALTATGVQEEAGEVLRAVDAEGQTLWAVDWGALRGTVRDGADGRPLAGAWVAVLGNDATSSLTATTDSAGRWTVGALAPGFHTVVARAPHDAGSVTAVVEVPAGDTARVDLRFAPLPPPAVRASGPTPDPSCGALRAAADHRVDSLLAVPASRRLEAIAAGDGGSEARSRAPVVVQVVVDTAGRPEMATLRTLRAEGAAMIELARRSIRGLQLPPTEAAPGCPVRAIVVLPMRFQVR